MSQVGSDIDAIRVTNLTKRFGDFTAVDDLSFQVKAGELFALLGLGFDVFFCSIPAVRFRLKNG